jgi:ATP synthase protein I
MELENLKNRRSLSNQIAYKERRKLKAQKDKQSAWFGLGMFGLVGWSITVPTLAGVGLGIWLDAHYPQSFSWTLSLLLGGLLGGCIMAWQWVYKEDQNINNKENDNE